MRNINRVIVTGNLTRDPELRSAGSTSVLVFSIAVNDERKNPSTGEWDTYANYIDCSVFGARAEALARILSKGAKVAIEGKLRYSSWEKDGQKRSKIDVNVSELELLTNREKAASAPVENSQEAYQPAPDVTVYDEDIPF